MKMSVVATVALLKYYTLMYLSGFSSALYKIVRCGHEIIEFHLSDSGGLARLLFDCFYHIFFRGRTYTITSPTL